MKNFLILSLYSVFSIILFVSCDDTNDTNDSKNNAESPSIISDTLFLQSGSTNTVEGENFGEEKLSNYRLLLDNYEIETINWNDSIITFDTPENIKDNGTIQIDKNNSLSNTINYVKKEFTPCELDGKTYSLETDRIAVYELDIDKVPECVGDLINLYELHLRRCKINTLPENIGNLKKLTSLRLEYNYIWIYPESFKKLTNLNTLVLGDNMFFDIPDYIGDFKELKTLSYGNNYTIKEIPESIGNLTKLQELHLSNNQLSSLPESIKNLKDNLETLYLGGNKFSSEEKAKIESWLPNTDIKW